MVEDSKRSNQIDIEVEVELGRVTVPSPLSDSDAAAHRWWLEQPASNRRAAWLSGVFVVREDLLDGLARSATTPTNLFEKKWAAGGMSPRRSLHLLILQLLLQLQLRLQFAKEVRHLCGEDLLLCDVPNDIISPYLENRVFRTNRARLIPRML
jgi:hypothetical protein